MLSLKQIEEFYPENIRVFKRNILREYLQYKILQIIFDTDISHKLSFIGGTSLRIVHNNNRFSEDIDFDNFGINNDEFIFLSNEIKRQLTSEGYKIEIKNVHKNAFRCYIRFNELLYDYDLTNIKDEKILVQVDTEEQGYSYSPEKYFLNKFDIFTQINITPLPVILSQKYFALFNRKVIKGRDLFDIVFLSSKTKPDYKYLKTKLGISNLKELKKNLLAKLKNVNLQSLVKDVQSFSINPRDTNKILLFRDYVEQMK